MNVLVSGVMEKGAAATKLERASVYVTYLVIVWKLPVVEVNSAKTWVWRATTEYRIFMFRTNHSEIDPQSFLFPGFPTSKQFPRILWPGTAILIFQIATFEEEKESLFEWVRIEGA